jgi:hypothetical protein
VRAGRRLSYAYSGAYKGCASDTDTGAGAGSGSPARRIRALAAAHADARLAARTVSSLLAAEQAAWRQQVGAFVRAHAETCMPVCEFDTIPRFAVVTQTQTQTQASCCCVATQCSIDRLPRLEALMRAWGEGAVSAAVYVPTSTPAERAAGLATVQAFADRMAADASYAGSLAVSVLFGVEHSVWLWDDGYPGCAGSGPLYPINALRNLAVAAIKPAATDADATATAASMSPLLFLLDVDFVPSPTLFSTIAANADTGACFRERCMRGEAFVVPAFENDLTPRDSTEAETETGTVTSAETETVTKAVAAEAEAVPTAASFATKAGVAAGVASGRLSPFHVSYFPRGHSPTDYPR